MCDSPDRKRGRDQVGETMPKATLGEIEIFYESHGTGTPVLLVPGLGGVGSYWAPNIPAFSSQYRVITHDHRGTGQSSRSHIRYSVDQMSGDLVRLLDHLEISQAHFVGHSTGGAIGQTLAVTNPERLKSLVIYASWTKADAFFRRVFEARRTLLTTSGAAAYVRSTAVFLYPDWWVNEKSEFAGAAREGRHRRVSRARNSGQPHRRNPRF